MEQPRTNRWRGLFHYIVWSLEVWHARPKPIAPLKDLWYKTRATALTLFTY